MKRICERAAGGHCSTTMTKLEVFDAWRDFRSRWDRAHQDYTPRISCEHLVTQREVVRPSAMLSAIDPGGVSQTIGSGQKAVGTGQLWITRNSPLLAATSHASVTFCPSGRPVVALPRRPWRPFGKGAQPCQQWDLDLALAGRLAKRNFSLLANMGLASRPANQGVVSGGERSRLQFPYGAT